MQVSDIELLFTRSDGTYLCARWGRPIAPVVFGVEDQTLATVKGACEAMVALAGHQMAETDPELGSNLMVFFFQDWAELLEVPDLDRLIPDLKALVDRLIRADANQYRVFRFDSEGGIKACFSFLRMGGGLEAVPAEDLCLAEMAQVIVLWSDRAFVGASPLAKAGDRVILRPDIGAVIRAVYDPVMPVASDDASHALRLAARIGQAGA